MRSIISSEDIVLAKLGLLPSNDDLNDVPQDKLPQLPQVKQGTAAGLQKAENLQAAGAENLRTMLRKTLSYVSDVSDEDALIEPEGSKKVTKTVSKTKPDDVSYDRHSKHMIDLEDCADPTETSTGLLNYTAQSSVDKQERVTISSLSSVTPTQFEYVNIRGNKKLKNETLYDLLRHLIDSDHIDRQLLYAFLLHLELLMSTPDLLDLILGTKAQKSLITSDLQVVQMVNILNFWIDNFPSDILNDQKALKKLTDFIHLNRHTTRKTHMMLTSLSFRLERKIISEPIRKENPYQNTKIERSSILEFDATELARQITLLDFEFFKNTSPREFITSKNPVIAQWCDQLKWWVVSEILNTQDIYLRVYTINRILDTAKALIQHNDFSGIKSIVDAFNCESIKRLTETFKKVSQEDKDFLFSLEQLLADKGLLNKRISSSLPPLIPWPGNMDRMFSVNICSERDGNTWVSIEAMIENSNTVQRIQNLQATRYKFKHVKEIQDHIINYPFLLDTLSSEIFSLLIQK